VLLYFFLLMLSSLCPYVTLCLIARCRSIHYLILASPMVLGCSTRNLDSAAWAIYAPTNELISLRGICLGRATNNIAEYSALVELLVDVISLRIRHLVVRLDSQLVVLLLSNVYSIRSPTLLRVYLWICLLERHFDYIEYQHIPRSLNTLTDALDNYVLDRHLNHL
jgi:ribonuclease HI